MYKQSEEIDKVFNGLKEDWEVIKQILPAGWEAAAREMGAVSRYRIFDNAQTLLRASFSTLYSAT